MTPGVQHKGLTGEQGFSWENVGEWGEVWQTHYLNRSFIWCLEICVHIRKLEFDILKPKNTRGIENVAVE